MTEKPQSHNLDSKVLTTIRHASLLAIIKEWGGDISAPPFDRDACGKRLCELGLTDMAAVCATIAAHDTAPQPPPERPLPPIEWKRTGRMISGSKSGYHSRFPHNLIVFNACVCTKSRRQPWNGDLDVTRDLEQLQARAREFGEALYVLWEGDGRRFTDNQTMEFDFSGSAAIIAPDGRITTWQDMRLPLPRP
jgi:hypothetical protein